MAERRRPRPKNRSSENLPTPKGLDNIDEWRALASLVCPKLKDEWEQGELATMLNEACRLLGKHFPKISAIANKAVSKGTGWSVSGTISRASLPAELEARIGYAEKFTDRLGMRSPDPNQTVFDYSAVEPETEKEKDSKPNA